MQPIVYLGFDPGAVTGVSWTPYIGSTPVLPDGDHNGLMRSARTPLEACDLVYDVLRMWTTLRVKPYRIIVSGETYTMGSSVRTHQPDALIVLGAVRWMTHKFYPTVEYRQVGAAEAGHVGNIKTLKAAGWWLPSDKDQHHNKAAAQVAYSMMTTEPRRWYDLINPRESSDDRDDPDRESVHDQVP